MLRDALPRLTETAGSEVTGETGGTDPLEAIRDALNRSHSGSPCSTSWVKTAG